MNKLGVCSLYGVFFITEWGLPNIQGNYFTATGNSQQVFEWCTLRPQLSHILAKTLLGSRV